jgi:Fe2+ transport system protein FeoA
VISRPAVSPMTLRELTLLRSARVVGLRLDDVEAAWLRALGVTEGASVQVLRVGPFRGPLQVRVGERTAFAIDRGVAGAIDVDPTPEPAR